MHYVDYVVLIAILGLIVWLIVRWLRRRGSGGPAVPESADGGGCTRRAPRTPWRHEHGRDARHGR